MCIIVYNECQWNCGSVQYFIMIVGGMYACLLVYSDCRWICEIVGLFSSL